MSEKYDSRTETLKHIETVREVMNVGIEDLKYRAYKHDQSKLVSPEVEYFDEYTPKLKDTVYLSPEYKEYMSKMEVGIKHHYSVNDHHPEFYPNGIKDMDLLSLFEMLSDWLAATKRHATGNIYTSVEKNQARFHYGDEVKQLLLNTLPILEAGLAKKQAETQANG